MVGQTKRYFSKFSFFMLVAFLFSAFLPNAPVVYAAPSSGWTECYSLVAGWPSDGKTVVTALNDDSGKAFQNCFGVTQSTNALSSGTLNKPSLAMTPDGVPVCRVYTASVNSNLLLSCTDPTTYYNSLYTPVVNIACPKSDTGTTYIDYYGHPVNQTQYDTCVNNAKTAYDSCNTPLTVGGSTGTIQKSASDIASCLIAAGIPGKQAELTTAITNGQSTASNLAAAVTNNAQSAQQLSAEQCKKDGGTWDTTKASCTTAESACTAAGNTWNADTKTCTKKNQVCSGGPLGWVLCPLSDLMIGVITTIAQYIDALLLYQPLSLSSTSNNPILSLWRIVVGPANLLLVIGFLIVIFSQATSVGLNAYGIKKLLPRIIAAAILINLSYFICAFAVDISNILGASVKGILTSIPMPDGQQLPGNWAVTAGTAAVGVGALVYGAFSGAIAYVVPILTAGAAAVLTAFVVIAARQILITLLIIISPLAFAAFVLPNTESLFTKWRKALVSLLAMYLIIEALFYGAQLVSQVMAASITSTGNGVGDAIKELIVFATLVAPLFAMPLIMKTTGGLLERFAGWTNDRSKGLIDRGKNWAKNKQERSTLGTYMATRKKIGDTNAKIRGYNTIGNIGKDGGKYARGLLKGRRTLTSRIPGADKLTTLGMGAKAQGMFNAQVAGMDNAAYREEVEAEQTRLGRTFNNLTELRDHFMERAKSGQASGVELHAAMNAIAAYPGSKTTIRQLLTDSSVMDGIRRSEASGFAGYTGVLRGWGANGKYGEANPDMKTALEKDPNDYLARASAGSDQVGALLRANYTGMGGDFRSWGWYAKRPSEILKLAETHTGQIFDKVRYQDAVSAQENPEFGKADPDIRYMINDIIAQGKREAEIRTQAARQAAQNSGINPNTIRDYEPNADFMLSSDYRPPAVEGSPTGWWRSPNQIDKGVDTR